MAKTSDFNAFLDNCTAEVQSKMKQEAEKKQQEQIKKQVQARHCDILFFGKPKEGEKDMKPIHADLTLERHPIFLVNSFKGDHFSYEREITRPGTSETLLQRIIVGKYGSSQKGSYGVLKQVHQQIFYRLLEIWGDQGYPIVGEFGVIRISAYKLVMALRNNESKKHYDRVQELLHEIKCIPVTIENALSWEGIKTIESFSLIHGIEWKREKNDKTKRLTKNDKTEIVITLSSRITESFLRKNIKKLFLEPYESMGTPGKRCRAGIARLLYPILDYELARKDEYSIRLSNLGPRLGTRKYQHKSERKRKFLPAAEILNGKLIQDGEYKLFVEIVETADKSDYMLAAKKIKA